MGGNKLWADLGGRPLVAWPISVLSSSGVIDALVVVAAQGSERRMSHLLDELGVRATVVTGGASRQHSVRAALDATVEAEWVVVHDGARPFVTPDIIVRGLDESRATGAAIAAVPVTDTIKLVNGDRVASTPARDTLWAAQTPQVFRRSLLLEAHRRATMAVTDDAALVEALGASVRVYMGSYGNIKVTTAVDLQLAALLLERERGRRRGS